jgi:hypothetical protein
VLGCVIRHTRYGCILKALHPPTADYASKYPPAQGLMLALGRSRAHSIVGVWIGTALACAAVYWMLLAWLPPGWALLGGAHGPASVDSSRMKAKHTGWNGGNARWGIGFGALRRIVRRANMRDSLMLGIGLAVLANSRPYEGLGGQLAGGCGAACLDAGEERTQATGVDRPGCTADPHSASPDGRSHGFTIGV